MCSLSPERPPLPGANPPVRGFVVYTTQSSVDPHHKKQRIRDSLGCWMFFLKSTSDFSRIFGEFPTSNPKSDDKTLIQSFSCQLLQECRNQYGESEHYGESEYLGYKKLRAFRRRFVSQTPCMIDVSCRQLAMPIHLG